MEDLKNDITVDQQDDAGVDIEADDLFDDVDETEVADVEEESEAEETEEETADQDDEPEEKPSKEPSSETLEFKYKGEQKLLGKNHVEAIANELGKSPEEVVTLLQKGMNYDPLAEKNQSTQALLEQFGKASNASVGDVLKQMQEFADAKKYSDAVEAARKKYPNAPEEAIKEAAQIEMDARAVEQAQEEQRAASQEQQVMYDLWLDTFTRVPGMKELAEEDKLPEMVKHFRDSGFNTPTEAALAYKVQELENQNKAASKTSQIKQKSVGSSKGELGQPKDLSMEDAFAKAVLDG